MEGVKAIVTMSRTLYIEVPEGSTNEEIIEKAKSEIKLPHNALNEARIALNKVGINIPKLDLNDWEVDNVEYRKIE